MKHYVLFKFEPDYYDEKVLRYTKEVFCSMAKQLEGIVSLNVHSNCVVRDSNMDMMIEMELKNKGVLDLYLDNALHKAFAERTDKHLVLRVSFDYED